MEGKTPNLKCIPLFFKNYDIELEQKLCKHRSCAHCSNTSESESRNFGIRVRKERKDLQALRANSIVLSAASQLHGHELVLEGLRSITLRQLEFVKGRAKKDLSPRLITEGSWREQLGFLTSRKVP